jgi:hypothetical protein
MSLRDSKSILAKLLASEDLIIEHRKVHTASFQPQNRILTLPVWTDMDGVLYDLLVGHEVGHALFTPAEGWHDAIARNNKSRAFAGFLNIVEDARIEKFMKNKFPGLRPSFYAAYQQLLDRDFFGLANKNIADMLLIDRLNLHFKVGSQLRVPFKAEENMWVDRMQALETWEDVQCLAQDLFDYCKKELEEKQEDAQQMAKSYGEQGEEIEGDDDSDADFESPQMPQSPDGEEQEDVNAEPVAETDEAFRNKESDLLDSACLPYANYYFRRMDSTPIIEPYDQVMSEISAFLPEQEERRATVLREFREKNDRYVNFLVQQFEMRRSAQQQARARIAKSGELDMKKIFNYRISEDLFRRFTALPNGKNHGMIMMYDMSGSMSDNMGPVIEQMLVLVQFCRKVNIKFEVYGFSNLGHEDWDVTHRRYEKMSESFRENDIIVSDKLFKLRQYFSDSMSSTDFKRQFSNMVMLHNAWGRSGGPRWKRRDNNFISWIPDNERLNGTPLNDAILMLPDVFERFKARTGAEIVNMVVLTDGQSDTSLRVASVHQDRHERTVYQKGMAHPRHHNVVLIDVETKKSVQIPKHDRNGTRALIEFVQKITGSNIVGFHITHESGRGAVRQALFDRQDPAEIEADLLRRCSELRRTGVVVSHDQGYAEHYLIKGGQDLAVSDNELDVEENASVRTIERAFSKLQNNKKSSRVLLGKFIAMVA